MLYPRLSGRGFSLTDNKATYTLLKGESRGKFSHAFFSTDTRTDFAKGVLNIPLLQCLSSLF